MAEQEEDDMKQIVQWPPRSNKIRWLVAGSRDRIALRAGLRLAASISTVFRPAVAFSNRATKHVSLALGRAGKMDTRIAARLAWSLWGLSLALTALSLVLLALNMYDPNLQIFELVVEDTLIAVVCSTVGAVVASRRPENPIGWIFCAIGLFGGVERLGTEYVTYSLLAAPGFLPGREALAWIMSWLWVPHVGLYVFLGLLFPDGRLPSSRWRWFAWFSVAVVLMGTIWLASSPEAIRELDAIRDPLEVEGTNIVTSLVEALLFSLEIVVAASLFLRLRRARGVERLQLKWFAYATTVLASGALLMYVVSEAMGVSWAWWVGLILVVVGIVGVPIAVGIAILKYRLYDIDFVINRTLVYGALTASIVSLYVLVVGGLGALLQARGSLPVTLMATGVVAILFAPLRDRLQCGVNRLMYGERDEPYAVLSRLGQRLEATLAPDEVLPTIVEMTAQALKLPYAAILLKQNGEFVTAAQYGTLVGDPVRLQLVYQTELIGQLVLAPRAPGEAFTPSDQRLLDDLARQAGVVVYSVRLNADLQRSRERLVTTREEERRRLRRDLHDGLGPTLAGLTFGLDAARNLLACEREDADGLLAQLKNQTQEAASDVRRLVYGLRPPALDELGLVHAVRQQAARHGLLADSLPQVAGGETGCEDGLVFSVETSEHLPPLPAAVEVSCYRIAQEAMTNVARHARARACRVRLSIDVDGKELELAITDDGVGLPADRRCGVGLGSMRERAVELGGTCTIEAVSNGGTRVLARLPLPSLKEHQDAGLCASATAS